MLFVIKKRRTKINFTLFIFGILFLFQSVSAISYTWDIDNIGNYIISPVSEIGVNNSLGKLGSSTMPVHVSSVQKTGSLILQSSVFTVVRGDYAYVASFDDHGMQIIDVSDPANPIPKGSITDDATSSLMQSYGIALKGNYAYIVGYFSNGMDVVDISDPNNPTHIAEIVDDGVKELNRPSAIYIDGNYAYITAFDDNGLEIVDISDPTNPTHVGAITDDATTLLKGAIDVIVKGSYAYVAARYDHGIEIIDISDPANPTHAGALVDDANMLLRGAEGIDIVGNYMYVASRFDDGLEILDMSDPVNLVHLGSIKDDGTTLLSSSVDVVVKDNYAYVISWDDHGIEIVDISDPTNPTHAGLVRDSGDTLLDMTRDIFLDGDYLYVSCQTENGIEILKITDSYYTNKPYIESKVAKNYFNFISTFSGVVGSQNLGTIKYQVSVDSGVTRNYFDGTNWVVTVKTDGTETSTSSDINTNISNLDIDGGDFSWRAYFESDGLQKVELDKVIMGMNSIPTDIKADGLDTDNVDENTNSGTIISVLTTEDLDLTDSHTYTFIVGTGDEDNSKFTISGDKLKLAFIPDFETPLDLGDTTGNNTYSIRVNTNDGNGGNYEKIIIIIINDTNETCMFNGSSLNNGESVTAYQSNSVSCGGSCVAETRTCNGGVLDGTYTESSCSVASCGGGGGQTVSKDYCPNGDYTSSYYDGECGDNNGTGGNNNGDNNDSNNGDSNIDEYHSSASSFDCYDDEDEVKKAYCFARHFDITTIDGYENAMPFGSLTRADLAKKMVNFSINVLGREKPSFMHQECLNYNDLSGVLSELKVYIALSCEMKIMGIHSEAETPKVGFDPNQLVTRAEFGTVLSRVLWGDKYNGDEHHWYQGHLNVLNRVGFINEISGPWPYYNEVRDYVWITLERISKLINK